MLIFSTRGSFARGFLGDYGSRSRKRPSGTALACGRFASLCIRRWRTMSQGGVVGVVVVVVVVDET